MCVPSGVNTGWVSSRSGAVRRFTDPEATSTRETRLLFGVPPCDVPRCVMAMVFPSGDHASGDGAGPGGCATGRLQEPLVRRRAFSPEGEMSQMCDGVGVVVVR